MRYDTGYIDKVISDFAKSLLADGIIDPRLTTAQNIPAATEYWDKVEVKYDEDRLLIEGLFGQENFALEKTPPDSPRIIDAIRNEIFPYVVRHGIYLATMRAEEGS